jgi:hypothetical protein
MTMQWFRVHHSTMIGTRFKRLSKEERYHYLHLTYLASISEIRGTVLLEDEDIAFELDLETEDWLVQKAKFRNKGFLEYVAGGVQICKWKEEQEYASDSSAERTRAYRERKRVTSQTVTETSRERVVTASDTDPDPDPDPDPEKKERAKALKKKKEAVQEIEIPEHLNSSPEFMALWKMKVANKGKSVLPHWMLQLSKQSVEVAIESLNKSMSFQGLVIVKPEPKDISQYQAPPKTPEPPFIRPASPLPGVKSRTTQNDGDHCDASF